MIDKALNNLNHLSDPEREQLMAIYGMFGMTVNPRSSTIRKHVLSMARNELVFKPQPFIELMKSGIPEIHKDLFSSVLSPAVIDNLIE